MIYIFNLIPYILVLPIILIIAIIIKSIMTWNKNNHSPKLTVRATVIAKRIDISHHNSINQEMPNFNSSSTSYYVTFQVESGDRMEFYIKGSEYGMLVEGDIGDLSFQGTRYLSFKRV